MSSSRKAFFAGLLMLVFAVGCERMRSQPLNIVLITVDTLRADRLAPYGYEKVRSPHIQALADDGILFESAICDTTWTTPSVASVMTGKYPFEHGVRTLINRLPQSETTLAEVMAQQGYRTGAIVGSFPLDRRFGFAQGFDSYDDDVNTAYFGAAPEAPDEALFDGSSRDMWEWYSGRLRTQAYRPDDQVATRAIEWLDGNDSAPFFLWVHFFGPHEKPNAAIGGKRHGKNKRPAREVLYDRDVEKTDRQVGRVLDRIALDSRADRTVILFHSDHGQTLSEHEKPGHGFDLYDTNARVPLIIRLPGGERAGTRVARLVRNIDIFPTLAGLAGAKGRVGSRAQDLLSSSGGDEPHAYLETFLWTSAYAANDEKEVRDANKPRWGLRGLRTARFKLIVRAPIPGIELAPDEESLESAPKLYDLEADPGEELNVASVNPEQLTRMLELLGRYPDRVARSRETLELDASARESLQALGYLE